MKAVNVTLLSLLCFQVLLGSVFAQASEVWLLRDGAKVQGTFVRLLSDRLLIKDKEKDVFILRDWLAPVSLERATTLEKKVRGDAFDAIRGMEFAYVSLEIFRKVNFEMGAPKENKLRQEYEPNHPVRITKGFFLKTTEVTWAEWNAVRDFRLGYGEKGYHDLAKGRNGYKGDASGTHPVTEITWWDAVKWCNLKSQIENRKPVYYTSSDLKVTDILTTGEPKVYADWKANGYRLPTEAEWEIAWHCGGWAKGFDKPDAWHHSSSEGNTHPVRTRPSASACRFHDMLGNVAEWCWDWKGPLGPGLVTDPTGPDSGAHHVFRGGSWADDETWCCTPIYRGDFSPAAPASCFVGFRPACNALSARDR